MSPKTSYRFLTKSLKPEDIQLIVKYDEEKQEI